MGTRRHFTRLLVLSSCPILRTPIACFVTTYAYNDAFDRLTRITRPNGAQTNTVYADPTWVITQQDQVSANDKAIQTQVVYDNFGRKIEDRLVVDANDLIDLE